MNNRCFAASVAMILVSVFATDLFAMPIGLRFAMMSETCRVEDVFDGEWTFGAEGEASAEGFIDSTATGGKSVMFMAADDSLAWAETIVTNACRVTFDWKSSCEGLVKGNPYDYLAFAVDGERCDFICGETDWTNAVFHITGDGEHCLRWTFTRDEDGSSGKNRAWLANVKVSPLATLTFAGGDATEGLVPEAMEAYLDDVVTLPDHGSLAWPKHTFIGWSDGENIYHAGENYHVLEADVVLTAVWEENEPETFGEYLNWPEQEFITSGDAGWLFVKGFSADGYALKSGVITHCQTSRLDTVVSGPGTITFSCKVAGEIVKKTVYDGLAFCIDGVQQGDLLGNVEWMSKSFEVAGAGSHTLSWLYVKDDGDIREIEGDCAWIDNVAWIPSNDLIPEIPDDAAPEAVTNAIESAGFADADVKTVIGGSATEYNAFKTWAASVKGAAGSASSTVVAGEAAVIANINAAAAYILGAEQLFENAPKVEIGQVVVGDSGLSTSGQAMTIAVIVKDGDVPVSCMAEKVAALFEATSDLGDWTGISKLMPQVEILESEGNTLRFKVTPGDGKPDRAFLRIRK